MTDKQKRYRRTKAEMTEARKNREEKKNGNKRTVRGISRKKS